MLQTIDYVVIVGYFLIAIGIGVWASRRVRHTGDFLVCGRSLGKFLTTMLSLGSATNTDQTISVVAQSYRTGLSGIWFQWIYLFGTATAWLLAPVCRRARVQTAAEFYRLRYSTAFSVFYACVGMVILTVTIGTMLIAMGATIEAVTQGAIPENVAIGVTSVVFLFYGALGGLVAAVLTDALQGLLILFLSFAMIPAILGRVGGFSGLHATLPPEMFSLAAPTEMTLFVIVVFSVQAVIGTPGGPNVIPGYSASRNEMDARVGVVAGSLIKRACTLAWAIIGIGTLALFQDQVSPDEADKAFGFAVAALLPPGLLGLMVAAMFAAVMSTCDATMVFASGLFTKDILPHLAGRRTFSEKTQLAVSRVASVFVVIAGFYAAYLIPNIRAGFIYLWQITLFACFPFWCGVVWKRGTSLGAWASVVGTFLVWLALELTLKKRIPAEYTFKAVEFLICLPAGFILFVLFSFLGRPENEDKLRQFYRRLNAPVGTDEELDRL